MIVDRGVVVGCLPHARPGGHRLSWRRRRRQRQRRRWLLIIAGHAVQSRVVHRSSSTFFLPRVVTRDEAHGPARDQSAFRAAIAVDAADRIRIGGGVLRRRRRRGILLREGPRCSLQ